MSTPNSEVASIVARIEKMEEEKQAITDDIKDLYTEAKSKGHNPKEIRLAVKRRRETAEERAAREQLEDAVEMILSVIESAAVTAHGQEAGR